MYEQFFGLTEKPFNTTPDSKFFYPSPKHTEALNSLIYAISERKGFVVITGEIGVGKTTVWRTLVNKLDSNTNLAVLTNTHLTCRELIAGILEELQVEYKPGTKQKLLSQLNDYLIRQLAADTNVVLIIDEAQNLAPKVLEEVRMLSNLETEKEKMIQIILIGQPQLKAKLSHPRLEQFKQRIAVYYHMSGLSRQETEAYIMHRIRLASSNGVDIFTPRAIEAVYNYSRGIPRLINLVCDSALLSGYIYETKRITENIIQDVIKERDFQQDIREEVKLHCCSDCASYAHCETKWLRGTKQEEQLCCSKCQDYLRCTDKIKKE